MGIENIKIFKDKIEEAVGHIASFVNEELSKDAKEGLAEVYRDIFRYFAGDALDGMCRDIISRSYPFAAFDMNLCTREQIREASDIIKQKLVTGELTLPETLMRVADERCRLLENALCSMFAVGSAGS
ncbi:MAG: hypothetical protein K6E34_08555 [Lachnospiraceae bacterium]|nr:hypothetical protein [Lachnospiraceae bacterium]